MSKKIKLMLIILMILITVPYVGNVTKVAAIDSSENQEVNSNEPKAYNTVVSDSFFPTSTELPKIIAGIPVYDNDSDFIADSQTITGMDPENYVFGVDQTTPLPYAHGSTANVPYYGPANVAGKYQNTTYASETTGCYAQSSVAPGDGKNHAYIPVPNDSSGNINDGVLYHGPLYENEDGSMYDPCIDDSGNTTFNGGYNGDRVVLTENGQVGVNSVASNMSSVYTIDTTQPFTVEILWQISELALDHWADGISAYFTTAPRGQVGGKGEDAAMMGMPGTSGINYTPYNPYKNPSQLELQIYKTLGPSGEYSEKKTALNDNPKNIEGQGPDDVLWQIEWDPAKGLSVGGKLYNANALAQATTPEEIYAARAGFGDFNVYDSHIDFFDPNFQHYVRLCLGSSTGDSSMGNSVLALEVNGVIQEPLSQAVTDESGDGVVEFGEQFNLETIIFNTNLTPTTTATILDDETLSNWNIYDRNGNTVSQNSNIFATVQAGHQTDYYKATANFPTEEYYLDRTNGLKSVGSDEAGNRKSEFDTGFSTSTVAHDYVKNTDETISLNQEISYTIPTRDSIVDLTATNPTATIGLDDPLPATNAEWAQLFGLQITDTFFAGTASDTLAASNRVVVTTSPLSAGIGYDVLFTYTNVYNEDTTLETKLLYKHDDIKVQQSVVDEDGDDIAEVGEKLTYNTTITNDSKNSIVPGTLTINGDDKLDYSTVNVTSLQGYNSTTHQISVPAIGAGSSITITYTINAVGSFTDNKPIVTQDTYFANSETFLTDSDPTIDGEQETVISTYQSNMTKLVANDVELTQSQATDLIDDKTIISKLGAMAVSEDGSDISDLIIITDDSGIKDYAASGNVPIGQYEITLQVTDPIGQTTVVSVNKLSVINDAFIPYTSQIGLNSPVVFATSDNATIEDVTNAAKPSYIETYKNLETAVDLTVDNMVEGETFDGSTAGVYNLIYTFESRPGISASNVVTVYITDDGLYPAGSYNSKVSVQNPISVTQGSYWDPLMVPSPAPTAKVYDSTGAIVQTGDVEVVYDNVDTSVLSGTNPYQVKYRYYDSEYSTQALNDVAVNVVAEPKPSDAVISGNSKTVKFNDAPISEEELTTLLNIHAYDKTTGAEIDYTVTDISGYNYTAPHVGVFPITIQATVGDATVEETFALQVRGNNFANDYLSIAITGSDLTVALGTSQTQVEEEVNAAYQVVNQDATIIESGVPRLVATNYDSTKAGTYYFTYEASYIDETSGSPYVINSVNTFFVTSS